MWTYGGLLLLFKADSALLEYCVHIQWNEVLSQLQAMCSICTAQCAHSPTARFTGCPRMSFVSRVCTGLYCMQGHQFLCENTRLPRNCIMFSVVISLLHYEIYQAFCLQVSLLVSVKIFRAQQLSIFGSNHVPSAFICTAEPLKVRNSCYSALFLHSNLCSYTFIVKICQ